MLRNENIYRSLRTGHTVLLLWVRVVGVRIRIAFPRPIRLNILAFDVVGRMSDEVANGIGVCHFSRTTRSSVAVL